VEHNLEKAGEHEIDFLYLWETFRILKLISIKVRFYVSEKQKRRRTSVRKSSDAMIDLFSVSRGTYTLQIITKRKNEIQ
jgi:hypothetical protein